MVPSPSWRLGLPAAGSEAGERMGESQEQPRPCAQTPERLFFFLRRTETVYTGSAIRGVGLDDL